MKLAKTLKLAAFFTAAFISLNATSLAYAGATYAIDSVYDNVNSNYLESTPTFQQGASYDFFISSYGDDGIFSDATDTLYAGGGVFVPVGYFPYFTIEELDSGVSDLVPFAGHDQGYLFSGSFTIPETAAPGTYDAFAAISADQIIRDKRFFEVNVESSTAAVPEPATMAMVSLGLLGGFYRRMKNS